MDYQIRAARREDIAGITEIYNEAVLNSTATFDTEPKSVEDRSQWLTSHTEAYPVLVAVSQDGILGYASLSRYSSKQAYAATSELSVYVAESHRGKGIGTHLTQSVLDAGRRAGIRAVLSRIAGENHVSIRLHDALGFFFVGTLKEVGSKFGKTLDVHIYEKLL